MDAGDARAALPPAALRLLVPPLRLLAAFAWQVIQRRRVLLYGRLADLVALVTEEVPELLGASHKAQLILGLRARLVLEFCRTDGPAGGLASIQQHLGKIQACTAQLCSAHQEESGVEALETSYTNFSKLVLKLTSVPSEKEHFLREVFPVSYGEAYDRALQRLVAGFLARLEQLLPTPTLAQAAAWLSDGPSAEEEFGRSLSDAAALKTLLLHHRQLGGLSGEASPCREEEPGIMAVLALSHEAAAPSEAAAHREEVEDGGSSEKDSRDSSALAPTGPPGDESPSPRPRLHSNNRIGPAHIPTATPTEPGERRHPARARRRVKGEEVKGAERQAEGAEQKADRAGPPAASPAEPSGLDRRFLSARPVNTPPYADRDTRCPHCDKTFLLANQLRSHLKLHALPYRCLPCEKGFASRSGFYQHRRLHTRGRAFPCPRCARRFLCRYSLRQHQRTHGEDAAPAARPCPECGKPVRGGSLARHLRMHAGRRNFLCAACGKGFLSSGELLLHSRTHTGDAPYTCGRCGKAFTSRSHLTVHGRSHTGERPYACPRCPKRFLTAGCVRRHARSHDGARPFVCPQCAKGFSQSGNLKKHMSTHRGTPPPPPPP